MTISFIKQFKEHAKLNYYNGYHEFADCYTDIDLQDFFEECQTLQECIAIADAIIEGNIEGNNKGS